MLEKEAKEQSISINSLVNGILTNYAEWDRYMEKLQRVAVPNSQLRELFDNVSAETIHALAQEGALRYRDTAAFLFGSTDLPSIIRSIALIGRNSRLWVMEESLTKEISYSASITMSV